MCAQRRSRAGICLLLLLLASYSYFVYRGPIWNADSRMALVFALVDRHTLSIDQYHEMTEDKSFANGHYYSDKAIGTSLLAAPAYLLLKQSRPPSLPPEAYFLVRYLITFLVVSIPSSLLGVLFYSFLPEIGVSGLPRLAATLGLALGTIAFPFSTALFGHQLAATLLFASFLLLWLDRKRATIGQRGWWHLLGAGILAGYAVATEYPAAIGVVFLSFYAILSPPMLRRAALWAAGLLPPGMIILTYNTLAFGGPLSQGYAHLGGAPEFIQGMSQGLLGVTYPSLSALWGITLSQYRGLFFLSPFLLLAFPGWNRLRGGQWRSEAHLCAAIALCFLFFNASYFQWDGGYSLGPRHLIPALPFLALLAAAGVAQAPRVGAALVSLSVAIIWLFTSVDPFPGPEYTNPLFDMVIPRALSGSVNNNWGMVLGLMGTSSLLPLLLITALALLVLARGSSDPAEMDETSLPREGWEGVKNMARGSSPVGSWR